MVALKPTIIERSALTLFGQNYIGPILYTVVQNRDLYKPYVSISQETVRIFTIKTNRNSLLQS